MDSDSRFFLPTSPVSTALTSPGPPHLKMLLKTNWQNLGHGAVGGYGLLLSLGLRGSGCPGSPRRGGERGGGRLGSAGESPGTQETGRQTKELRSGAEAPGSGRAAMAEPGAAQTPETAEPCGGIPATELRPSHFTPPPPYVPLHGVPRCRGAQEFGAQCAEGLADGCDTAVNRGIEGTTFFASSLSPAACFSLPLHHLFLHFATSCD